MALTVGDREVRPLTADEVLRMVEAGILSEDEPVELLHGALTAVSPKSPAHEAVKTRLQTWLWRGAAEGTYLVRVEAPLVVPDRTSLPEPDLAVVAVGEYTTRHPTAALLVIEVAASSLQTDTTLKPALYAAARVPELWVVDIPGRRLHVLTDPRPDRYAVTTILEAGATVSPGHITATPLALADVFAGLPHGDTTADPAS
jgi:putative restriction endonuclease